MFVNNIIRAVGRYDLFMHVDSSFLQMFIWERLIVPKTMKFPIVITEEVEPIDGSKKTRMTNMHKPQAWRWLNAKPLVIKSLLKVLNKRSLYSLWHVHFLTF